MDTKTYPNQIKSLRVMERLDAQTSPIADKAMADLINRGTLGLVCNFSDTGFVSSAGLRIVLSSLKSLQNKQGQMVLCCVNEYVREVFETAGFADFMPIFDTEEQAVAHLQNHLGHA